MYPKRIDNHGNAFTMQTKDIKAIEKRTIYEMEAVIEWWQRMFGGWVKIDGSQITFVTRRMDNGTAVYTRQTW